MVDPSIADPYLSSLPDGGWTLVSGLGMPQFIMAAFTAILLIEIWHVAFSPLRELSEPSVTDGGVRRSGRRPGTASPTHLPLNDLWLALRYVPNVQYTGFFKILAVTELIARV